MHSASSVPGSGQLVAGRYRLLGQLGRGAMGIVWHGRDELLDRHVAVKQIILAPMASDADTRASYQRMLREARTAARLSHPGVVTVFDVVEDDGMPWIVMELIRARPLDQVIAEDGPLPPAQAAQLGLGLLDALSTAHAAGVLHRDVKPSNVLISPEGKAVLTDFGIATAEGDPGLTQSGMVVGTPGFSPPERIRGAEATPASDLWSLGATLYAAVEGRGPFDRAGGSAAIVASIATEPAPRAPSAGPLASVIEMLLRADPAERPDAAATSRLLTTAWADARRVSYLGAGSRPPFALAVRRDEAAAAPVDHAQLLRDPAGLEATTATQVVTMPGADTSDAEADDGSGPPSASALGAPDPRGGTGLPEAGSSADAPVEPSVAAMADLLPDLMATPVFAELKMPGPLAAAAGPGIATGSGIAGLQPGKSAGDISSAGPVSEGGSAGPSSSPGPGGSSGPGSPARPQRSVGTWLARLPLSRRGLVVTAPLAASAIVAGIVFLAFPGFGDSLVRGLSLPSGSRLGSRTAQNTVQGAVRRDGSQPGSGSTGGLGPAVSPQPSGAHRTTGGPTSPTSPSPSGKPTSSGGPSTPTSSSQPTASSQPTPSPTPTPTSPAPKGGELPPGYSWQSVTGQSIGTTAGFRLAAPSTWLMTPGLHTFIKSPTGKALLIVDMAPFAAPGPVREAYHLQAAAIAHHKYRRYHLVSISSTTFHGWRAAAWAFWWKPVSGARIVVKKIIFTAQTTAGSQPYILSISARATQVAAASEVFRVVKRTFSPLP
jgi:tRNA A-37 threonylcarbamoyl transferase component Bud32